MPAVFWTVVFTFAFSILLPDAARGQANPEWISHGDHEGVGLIESNTGAQLMVTGIDVTQVESTALGLPGAKFDSVLKQTDARAGAGVGFDIAWNHVALSVPNIAETIAWYEKMLGFKGTVRSSQPGARQQVADLRRGNITIELFQLPDAAPLPESRKNPSEDFRTHGVKHFGFEVKNLPAVLAELKAKGVKMAFEMRDTPTEAFAFISDNAGNAIELIEHKTP
jgi:methylmalonyl-CoA/ethylmalonyl-CoA epimerase